MEEVLRRERRRVPGMTHTEADSGVDCLQCHTSTISNLHPESSPNSFCSAKPERRSCKRIN